MEQAAKEVGYVWARIRTRSSVVQSGQRTTKSPGEASRAAATFTAAIVTPAPSATFRSGVLWVGLVHRGQQTSRNCGPRRRAAGTSVARLEGRLSADAGPWARAVGARRAQP